MKLLLLTSFCNLFLWTSAFSQNEFYYLQSDSIILIEDTSKCTIEFIDSANESYLIIAGLNFSKMAENFYEITGEFESIKTAGTGIYNTQKIYHTLNGTCLRLKSQVILRFKPNLSNEDIGLIEQQYGLVLLDNQPGWFRIYTVATPIETAKLLNESNFVDFCDPNFILPLIQCAYHPNDEFYDRQWHLNNTEATQFNDNTIGTPGADINAPEAWELTTGSPEVEIGVLYDTPQINHPDLLESKIDRTRASGPVKDSHGTAVCGIIAAEMDNNIGTVGIAPQCRLRLYNPINYGFPDDITLSEENQDIFNYISLADDIYSYVYMVNNGVRVTSHSGAISQNMDALVSVANTAMDQGLVIVRAALNVASHFDNDNDDTSPIDFVSIPNVIIVGASDRNDMQADYSPTSNYVDICAPSARDFEFFNGNCQNGDGTTAQQPIPGEECQIWTLDLTGDADADAGDGSMWDWNPSGVSDTSSLLNQNQYPSESICGNHLDYTGRFWGTSAATPQVAAAVALMLSANNLLTVPEVVSILSNTAEKTHPELYNYNWNPQSPGHSREMGHGRLNAHLAVQSAIDMGHVKFSTAVSDYSCNDQDGASFELNILLEPNEQLSDYSAYVNGIQIILTQNPQVINLLAPVSHVQLLKITNNNYICQFDGLPASSTRQIFIDHSPPTFLSPQIEAISCPGENDASVFLEMSCQKATDFDWMLNQGIIASNTTSVLVENLEPGIYQFSVSNNFGCTRETIIEILEPAQAPLNIALSSSNTSCSYSSDGNICATVSGGLPPYSYQWNNSIGSSCIQDIENGEYSLEVTDAIGCSVSNSATISSPPPLVVQTIGSTQTGCAQNCDASITLSITGGTGTPSINWPVGVDPNNLCSGNYAVSIVDQNGCENNQNIQISESTEICCPLIGIINEINYYSECQIIPGSNIIFDNESTSENLTYLWNFGDGSTSNQKLTQHTYTNAGSYSITLTLSSEFCDPFVISTSILINDFNFSENVIIDNQANVNSLLQSGSSFGGDIIFTANPNQYIISNTTLYLSEQTDILIQEGASVIFNNSILTSCGTWNGINVESNSDSPTTAGRLSFDPNGNSVSTIEFARIAIESFDSRLNANSTAVSNLQAGYITCNKTVFRNNAVSVSLRNAKMQIYTPAAGFTRCTFTVNDEMKEHFIDNIGDYNSFLYHVQSNRMLGYNFKGCSFKNEMTADTHFGQWKNRGIGIYSHSSRFNIDKATTTQVGIEFLGSFEGLDRGISTGKGISNLRISNQTFKKNHIGIFLSGAAYCRVYNNTFRIGEATGLTELDNQLTYGTFPGNSLGIENNNGLSYEGLVIQKGDFHEIAENTFNGYRSTEGGVSDDYARIGVRIRATNTEEMVVRKNSFSRLSFANLANGDNAGGTSTSGLRFICNTNSQNTQDFTNTDFLGVQNSAAIGNIQAEPPGTWSSQPLGTTWPAGNTFSADNPSTATHFRNEGVGLQSYWHANIANQTPTDFIGVGTLISQPISHACPSIYGSTHVITSHAIISSQIAEGNIARLEAEEYRYLYLLLVDDGDTEALQFFVENTWGAQVWNTREELLTISPFVSEDVLYILLDETMTYPHAMAFDIIAANPELLRNPKLINYLSDKNDPMPEYMIELLILYNQQSTERSDIEQTLGEKRTQHISKVSEALWGMMDYDDYTYENEDFRNVLSEMKVLNSEFFVINELLDEGNIIAAINRLDSIPVLIPLGKEEKYEYTQFVEWINWRKEIMLAGKDLGTLSSSDLQNLQSTADAFDSFASSLAISILNEVKEESVFTPPAMGKSAPQYKSKTFSPANFANSNISLVIYPNPANYLVQIELNQKIGIYDNYKLDVIDLLGQVIFSVKSTDGINKWLLDTTLWSGGIYTIKVSSSNGIEISEILNVAH
jgi:parallel beta-helix repeat protein